MAGAAALTISYIQAGRAPVAIATVDDDTLLREVAILAIRQARSDAEAAAEEDPLMGRLQETEVARLAAALELLIPGFARQFQPAAAGVM